MASIATHAGRSCLYRRSALHACPRQPLLQAFLLRPPPPRRFPSFPHAQRRSFSSNKRKWEEQKGKRDGESFNTRLGRAWRSTKIDWKPIPIGLGIAFLGLFQFARISRREEGFYGNEPPPPKRKRSYPSGGGWQVQIMSTLPLKAISRLWGRFNEITIPYYLRVPGFRLYGWIFGVNFTEIAEEDLHVFPNLAAFFYRELKPGLRPLDPHPNSVLSPADAKVLQFGVIENGEVEQVKGITYSVDALLGQIAPQTPNPQNPSAIFAQNKQAVSRADTSESISADEEFANVNGISYTLPNLFSGSPTSSNKQKSQDASTKSTIKSEAAVSADLATTQPWWSPFSESSKSRSLYYAVVYLAPGDYHRFHSPVSWICSSRRHFAGELYSVSPYVQQLLPGLFTLNERVVLLGRWKHGFYSYVAVGATNVGSVVINFDKELRTNSLTTDTEADRQAALAAERGEPYSGYSEATYDKASKLLGGHALRRGEEMGGFKLGSSVVLVFEAPVGKDGKSGIKWAVEKGQKVKMGEALGYVVDDE